MKSVTIPLPVDQLPKNTVGLISSCPIVFWDFDGVIKDSVGVKTDAFTRLFSAYGPEVAAKVKAHHEANGGLSRYEKIPLYLTWAGIPCDKVRVDNFCSRFSEAVLDAVIDSPWVPGVREYLLSHCDWQYFILVTATPQQEIELILNRLGIAHCFRRVSGAPTAKKEVIAAVLHKLRAKAADALLIGDSETDRSAAEANRVPLLLRRTAMNRSLQLNYHGPQFEDLL
jgi:phosphoglycolate phosphatase-like HAD superfamily hydrolase